MKPPQNSADHGFCILLRVTLEVIVAIIVLREKKHWIIYFCTYVFHCQFFFFQDEKKCIMTVWNVIYIQLQQVDFNRFYFEQNLCYFREETTEIPISVWLQSASMLN